MSLQRHRRRTEHWYIVSGEALVRVGAGESILSAGQAVDIPCGSLHRIHNGGTDDVVVIEIQTGEYFGEDDIERFEDDYGRV